MGLLDADSLIIDKVSGVFGGDFDISEGDTVVGHIRTESGRVSRLFTGHRQLRVSEVDGTQVLRLNDVMNFLSRDTFEIVDGGDRRLGVVRRELPLFSRRVTFLPEDGVDPLQVQRWRSRYRLTVHNEPVARVSTWGNGMRRGLLPSTTYVVSFQPGAGPRLRQVILGTVIALELLRTKGDGVAGSTG